MNEEEKKAADEAAKVAAEAEAKVKAEAEAKAKADAEAAEDANKGEKTIAEVLAENGGKKKAKDDEGEGANIPEAAFLDEKKGRKAAEKRVKELEDMIKEGGTRSEISDEIEDIAKKHNVDPGFLRELTTSITASLKKDAEDTVDRKMRPINERERAARIDKVFEEHFATAMERMPEFKGVVNKSVIKTLSLDPTNASKTFTQIIEDTYSAAVPGKRSIEQKQPGGGKEPGEIDFAKAKKDTEYFKTIMADPVLKKKYNEGLVNRVGL